MKGIYKQITLLKQRAMAQSVTEDICKNIALVPKGSKVGVVCMCENLVDFSFFMQEWESEDGVGTIYSEYLTEDNLRLVLMGMNLENLDDSIRKHSRP